MANVPEKKIMLMIVEGKHDETALGGVITRLVELTNMTLKVFVLHEDITSNEKNNSNNIVKRVEERVKEFLYTNDEFRPEDIAYVAQMTDADGVFIEDQYVTHDAREKQYDNEGIRCSNPEAMKSRNDRKKRCLRELTKMKQVKTGTGHRAEYTIYYFSCNHEHVFHDRMNASPMEKEIFASELSSAYPRGKEQEFTSFMKNADIAVPGSYKDTWTYLEDGFHSLQRCSNFHLFLTDVIKV